MTAPAGSDLRSYRRLDHYRLLACLGVGGMGEVWAARDLAAPGTRYVAVKVTKQEGVEAAKVLWDEARIASLIQHPNVCSVHEMGQADGTQYLVMDWCDGASLHDLLQKAPGQLLPLPLAVKIAAQVAAGLHAAHELVDEDGQALGVVHRDVSPQNVLLSSQGTVLVTDFGVAKAAGQAHRATETGEVKGKLSYMAPEQVKSKDVDRRADVFALGCLLYLATTGRRPFHGDDALATLYQILEKEVAAPSSLVADYPEALEAVVLKALAKDREQRFQSAEEFQVALERWLMETGTRVTEQDIGRALMEQLGESIRERKKLVAERDRHAARLAAGEEEGEPGLGELPPGDRESSSVSAAVVTRHTPPPEAEGTKTRSARHFLWGTLGLVAAVALAVAVGWRAEEPPGDVPAPASERSAVEPEPAEAQPKAPANVSVRIHVEPAKAEILLDGVAVGVGSYAAEVEPTGETHLVEARLAGHRAVVRRLAFDRNQDLHLELVPLADPAAAKAPPPRRSPSTAQPAPPRTPAAPMPPPPAKQKKPRPIDSTNPFESSP